MDSDSTSRIKITLASLVFWLPIGPALAAEPVDLELVLATDVSRSIDENEAQLQREGTAAAIRNPDVVRAIRSGFLRKIAVAYLDYSSADYNQIIIDWTVIGDQTSADAFSRKLLAAPLSFGRRTSISDAIEQGVRMIESNEFTGTRRVIDVAGDGPNNHGRLVEKVRNEAIAKRITINGLPIISPPGGFGAAFWIDDLDKYYQGCVVGGPGAFMVVAKDFKDFARAIRRKLIFEIAGLVPPSPPRLHRASVRPAAGPGGYSYPKGCDIGERMWQRRIRDGFFGDP